MSALFILVTCLAFLSAEVAAGIADDRDRSHWGWAFAGLIFPLAAPWLVWLSPPNPKTWDRCEHCAEHIRAAAVVCPHCTREVEGIRNLSSQRSSVPS